MQITAKRVVIGVAALFALGLIAILTLFLMITIGLPSAKDLANYEPPITSRVHAGDGKLVAEFANQHRVYVPADELPDQLIQAFISAEDKSFFEHSGVDWMGVIRGTLVNAVQGKRMAGGSTITQQVVKNMLVGSERSLTRKAKELVLAGRIEQSFTKHQILELYMNEIYLGGSSYGVGAASLNYFGKSLGELTLAEAAMLAALAQRPSEVNPYNHTDAAIRRRNYVLDRMLANGYVTKAAYDVARAEPLKTVSRLDTDENNAAAYYVEELRREIIKLGADKKLAGMENQKDATTAFYEGGLSIRSTLDSNMQLIGQTALRAGLESYDRNHGFRGPITNIKAEGKPADLLLAFAKSNEGKAKIGGAGNNWELAMVTSVSKDGIKLAIADGASGSLQADDVKWVGQTKKGLTTGDVIFVSHQPAPDVLSQTIADYGPSKTFPATAPWRIRQIPAVEGALVAMDPHTGRVLAMAGGYSFGKSQFNRAVQAMRQPGSSFKPFVYTAALENGWTPATRVLDAAYVDCDPYQKECYKPQNFEMDFWGLMPLRFGVEHSRNTMTVRLATDMGLNKVSEIGERMGIYDKLPPYPSMALGAGGTTPLRLATAYASLVNGGKQVHPIMLDRIQNRYGETIYRTDERTCTECKTAWHDGMQPPAFPDTRKQLIDPVTAYQMVSILEGAATRGNPSTELRKVGRPLAGKTGTTNDMVDAWLMGFSPDLVVGVWVGFDTPKPMGQGSTGGRVAAPIFRDFMIAALKNTPVTGFRIPPGVRLVEVDLATGCLPSPDTSNVILEAFKPGTEPTERCAIESTKAATMDFSKIADGDEYVKTSTPAEPQPDPSIAQADPNAPQVPGQPAIPGQPAQKPKDELTLKDGIF